MIEEIKQNINNNIDAYADICEIWAESNGADIVDDIVSNKYDIANLIHELLFTFNITAEAIEDNNDDHMLIYYWCEEIQRDVILKHYTMEDMADYVNFNELLKDILKERKQDQEKWDIFKQVNKLINK